MYILGIKSRGHRGAGAHSGIARREVYKHTKLVIIAKFQSEAL